MENQNSHDYDSAYEYCRETAVRHYENFPVGSLLIPKNKRKYIYSIYAFARFADDIADSGIYSEEEKLEKLNELESELTKIETGNIQNLIEETAKIYTALFDTVKSLNIPVDEFRNLLKAFKQDSVKSEYETFEELIEYSDLSANPIGHLVLYVFGYNPNESEEVFKYSDKICTALQLTNFWQDVSEDLKINRIYIPGELMSENNYSREQLFEGNENGSFIRIMKLLLGKTRELFEEGKGILNCTKGRLRLELSATIAGGMEILNKIEKIDYKVLSTRVVITGTDKIRILGKVIF